MADTPKKPQQLNAPDSGAERFVRDEGAGPCHQEGRHPAGQEGKK